MLGKKAQEIKELRKAVDDLKMERMVLKDSLRSRDSAIEHTLETNRDLHSRLIRMQGHEMEKARQYIEETRDAIYAEESAKNKTMILKALNQYLKQLSATSDAHGQAILLEEFLSNIGATEEDRTIIFTNKE